MQWYYSIDGQRLGPVPHAELERLIQAGTITGDALIWRQGMDQWKTLADVQVRDPAMFSLPPPPPPLPDAVHGEAADPEAPAARRPAAAVPEAGAAGSPPYAGFWVRTAALVVDLILWFFVWQILSNLVAVKFFPEVIAMTEEIAKAGGSLAFQPTPEQAVLILKFSGVMLLIGVVWGVVYDLFFLLRLAATPGKILFGLRVVRANGDALSPSKIVARCLAKGLVVFTLGIGYLIVAFDDEKRGMHDYFCDTRVVKKR